jgi:hypothetical protein
VEDNNPPSQDPSTTATPTDAPHRPLASASAAKTAPDTFSESAQGSVDTDNKAPEFSQLSTCTTQPANHGNPETSANEKDEKTGAPTDNSGRLLQDLLVLEQMVSEMREGVGELKRFLRFPTMTDERHHEVGRPVLYIRT